MLQSYGVLYESLRRLQLMRLTIETLKVLIASHPFVLVFLLLSD